MSFYNILENTARAAENTSGRLPVGGDFIKDGLWHCGKCGTPKQTEIRVNGRVLRPFCLCECAAAAEAALEKELKRRERLENVRQMRREAFPLPEMREWTFDRDDGKNPRLTGTARRYADNFDTIARMPANNGLILYGGVGSGKSFLAACIVNALTDKGHPCLMTTLSRIANIAGGAFDGRQEYLDSLRRYDLLVLDDFASERETDYMNEMVFGVIDARAVSGKPLIVTTNLTAEELKNPGTVSRKRVFSRLLERCVPVDASGADRRRDKLRSNYDGMTRLLNVAT